MQLRENWELFITGIAFWALGVLCAENQGNLAAWKKESMILKKKYNCIIHPKKLI
jgi:hypothetical protein